MIAGRLYFLVTQVQATNGLGGMNDSDHAKELKELGVEEVLGFHTEDAFIY